MSSLAQTVPPARDASITEAGEAMRWAVDEAVIHARVCRWRKWDMSCARCDGLEALATAAEDRYEAARRAEG